MELKLPVVKNKRNKQLTFSLPKKKISKELLKQIQKNKYIKLKLMGG
jgi:hypothetical protein